MPGRHVFRTWDDYYIPGTTVLRNKFIKPGKPYGEDDPAALSALEEGAVLIRAMQFQDHPIDGGFDYDHMKAIHRFLFQDVYEWAGQERVAPVNQYMTKMGPDVVHYAVGDPDAPKVPYQYYPAGPALTAAAEAQYAKLARENFLQGMGHDRFAVELAEIWGELNVVHSFREGNTRTQFTFFSQLAKQAGWELDPLRFAPGTPGREQFVAARFYSQATGDNERLAEILGREIRPFIRHIDETESEKNLKDALL
jgi:cell filamentation protein